MIPVGLLPLATRHGLGFRALKPVFLEFRPFAVAPGRQAGKIFKLKVDGLKSTACRLCVFETSPGLRFGLLALPIEIYSSENKLCEQMRIPKLLQ